MTNLAKQLMDEFHAAAVRAGEAEDYEQKSIYDNAENLVNNVMHGQPFTVTVTRVRAALVSNSDRANGNDVARQHYLAAVELLDLFVAINQ